jgi:hypothetical protein
MDITIILFGITGILLIWCIILTLFIAKEKQVFKELAKGVTKKDLLSVLRQITHSLNNASTKIENIELKIGAIQQSNHKNIQKIGFVRFNPFSDTGGDQSFCLCLLDQDNNGIVITSLHSRDTTRFYAKQITQTTLKDVDLSLEEVRCYNEATSHKINTNSHEKESRHDGN